MNLFLLRHAKAVELGADGIHDDRERPLAPDGRKKMHKIAFGMSRLGLSFDLVLSSPLKRARQTAEIASQALPEKPPCHSTSALVVQADPARIVDDILRNHPRAQSLLLVGHEPHLGNLMSYLLTGGLGLAVHFRKAALAKISVDPLRHGQCGVLEWFLTPQQMMMLGGPPA